MLIRRMVLLVGGLVPLVLWAMSVQITEVSPHKVGSEEEWWEFVVEGEAEEAVMQDWQVQRDDLTPKKLKETWSTLLRQDQVFTWDKSPVSLPNSGGTVRILGEDGAVLSEVTYPKLKAGSRDKAKYAEVWAYDPDQNRWGPQVHWTHELSGEKHSRGRLNPPLPTHFSETTWTITKVRPLEDGVDYLVLQVHGPDDIHLQNVTIKHNGTILWQGESGFWVRSGSVLTLFVGTSGFSKKIGADWHLFSDKRSGLSGGSGTIEVFSWYGTSFETLEATYCYAKGGKLSKTEGKRVAKWGGGGSCKDIEVLVEPKQKPEANSQQPIANSPPSPLILSPWERVKVMPDWVRPKAPEPVVVSDDSFFGDFLNAQARRGVALEDLRHDDLLVLSPPTHTYDDYRTMREKLAYFGRLEEVEHNLGAVFLERNASEIRD